jgi:16S rRNA (guanine966-N2)-methyltransferase
VESARCSLRVLRANIAAFGLEGRCRVVEGSAEAFTRRPSDSFDLILADPPYAFTGREDLVDAVIAAELLAPDGVFVFEHAADARLEERAGWTADDRREFGTTAVTFIRHKRAERSP